MVSTDNDSTPQVGRVVLSAAVGYITGTFPSADIASRLAGRAGDVRREGSRNPGATNAAKVLGRAWGASVLVADIAKGSLATTTGRRLASDIGAVAAGVGTVLGHCFPPGRAGGKGVATRYGALVVVTPELAILDLVVAATVARLARKPDFAMTLSAVTSAVAGALALRLRATPRWSPVALAALSGAVVLVRFFQERVRRREIAGPGIT